MKNYKIKRTNDALLEERSQSIQKWINEGEFKITVHDGEFHADEIIACSLLEHAIGEGELKITRTRNLTNDASVLVVDVGEGIFDHHGDAKLRNGNFAIVISNDGEEVPVPHCGATLVASALEKIGCLKIGPALERELVSIAAQDNGVSLDLIPRCSFINDFNTSWDENRADQDQHFQDVLKIVVKIIHRMMMVDKSTSKEIKLLEELPIDKEVVVLPYPGMSWTSRLASPDSRAKFVIFDGGDGTWYLQCVPPSPERWTEKRIALPEAWTKRPRNSGEFIFCHIGRFIAGYTSREAALRAAEEALRA